MSTELKKWIKSITSEYDSCEDILSLDNLNLSYYYIKEISLFLNDFKGTINLSNNLIREIPEGFVQNNFLDLSYNKIEKIPNSFKQKTSLFLSNNRVEEMPEEFVQKGVLDLRYNLIKEIPKGFVQDGDLYLNSNRVTKIPNNFVQNGILGLKDNPINDIGIGSKLEKDTLEYLMSTYGKAIKKREHALNKNNFIKSVKDE